MPGDREDFCHRDDFGKIQRKFLHTKNCEIVSFKAEDKTYLAIRHFPDVEASNKESG